jgi:hypothetical protein
VSDCTGCRDTQVSFNGLKTVYLGEMEKAAPIKDLTFAFIAGKICD